MAFQLPNLDYDYNALEPYIRAEMMELHHRKHHQAYTNKFNAVIEKYPHLADQSPEDILVNLGSLQVDEADRLAIRNHGGGYVNHAMFWEVMGPSKEVDTELAAELKNTFGSLDDFKKKFEDAANTHFGSGWAWLVRNQEKKLEVYSLPNQDSPLTLGHEPILALDVWEHAYYLQYQNRRPEYTEAWWNVVKIIE